MRSRRAATDFGGLDVWRVARMISLPLTCRESGAAWRWLAWPAAGGVGAAAAGAALAAAAAEGMGSRLD